MASSTNAKSGNGTRGDQPGSAKAGTGPKRLARSIAIGDTIQTSHDFANFMSTLIGDIVSGRIDARTANAACNAGGKLLHVVELEHKYAKKNGTPALQLANTEK